MPSIPLPCQANRAAERLRPEINTGAGQPILPQAHGEQIIENGKLKIENEKSWNPGIFTTEDTEYIFTMKNMKVMKIIHESANEHGHWRVHSLTPFFLSIHLCPSASSVDNNHFIHSWILRFTLNEPSVCKCSSSAMDNNLNLFLSMNCCISGVMFFTVGTIKMNGACCER